LARNEAIFGGYLSPWTHPLRARRETMTELIAKGYHDIRPLVDMLGDRLLFIAAVIVALLGAALIGMQLIDMFAIDPAGFNRI
jgi:hypothetical protein